MTVYTIIKGLFLVAGLIVCLVAAMIWIDSYYDEPDEHADTDNSRG
jgi:hypothetical protein